MGVAAWLFWEFFHARWKILFSCGGDMQGGCKMRIVTQGEKYLCEVTLRVVEGTLGHAIWMRDEIWKVIWRASHMHLACILCENFGVVEGTLGHARWTWGEIWKVISHENFGVVEGTLGHARWTWGEIWKVISHENFGVVEGTLGHARWMWGEIWKVIPHAPHMRNIQIDVTSSMSQGQMMNICKIFPYILFKCHLAWTWGDTWSHYMDTRWDLKSHITWEVCIWCYLFDVLRPNDEDLQDFNP